MLVVGSLNKIVNLNQFLLCS